MYWFSNDVFCQATLFVPLWHEISSTLMVVSDIKLNLVSTKEIKNNNI